MHRVQQTGPSWHGGPIAREELGQGGKTCTSPTRAGSAALDLWGWRVRVAPVSQFGLGERLLEATIAAGPSVWFLVMTSPMALAGERQMAVAKWNFAGPSASDR